MIDTTALKNSILDLAFHGKLTSQNVTDGSAEELYNQICDEKRELIKSGKIKKNKIVPIKEEDIPFEIPNNWKWIRWGDLSEKIQYGYNASAKSEGRIKMVRISDIQDNKVLWDTVPYCEIDEEQIPEYLLKENDILFARTGGTVGKSYIVSDVPEDAVFAGYLIRTSYSNKLSSQYMKYFMESKLYWKQLRNGTIATAQPNCNGQTLSKMMVPLPPYAEQVRIIETIEKAFAQIDVIDSLQQQYSSDLEVLKSKIIDAGIQGKLTEQLPGDGTADELLKKIAKEKKQLIKEKKIKATKALPEITEDEIPFEIPDNWKWVRLSEIMDVRDGTHDSPKYVEDGIPLVTSKNISSGGLDFTNVNYISQDDANKINERSNVDTGDILFAMIGTIGNPVIVEKDREFCIKNVALFKNFAKDKLDIRYVYWMLMREQYVMKKKAIGGLQPFISLKVFREYPVPLPPIAEQRRIADKLDDVISMC